MLCVQCKQVFTIMRSLQLHSYPLPRLGADLLLLSEEAVSNSSAIPSWCLFCKRFKKTLLINRNCFVEHVIMRDCIHEF